MKGGLLLNNELKKLKTIQQAVNMFKSPEYATFNLLTNSSIACITFKATLKPGIISPFVEIRSDIFGKPVNSLLFKYFPIRDPYNPVDLFITPFYRGSHNFIEVTKESDIMKEYSLQLKIYQQTYNTISSAYEPVCPYPIQYQSKLSKNDTIIAIIKLLEDTHDREDISTQIIDTLGYESVDHPDDEFRRRQDIKYIGCVVMEFMEDYVPLGTIYKTLSNSESDKIKSLIAYELSRLQYIGVIHGDLHLGNIMYNKNYKYITDGSNPKDLGRVLLIDFGRSKDNKQSQTKNLSKKYGKLNAVGEVNEWNYRLSLFKFKKPYTFEYIYSKRLELTLQFRQNIINNTITSINEFLKTQPDTIAVNELEKFKTSNKIKLGNAVLNIKSLYPQNFFTSNNVFDNDEFHEPFNQKKQTIFKDLNMTKRLKIDKIKNRIPLPFYPNVSFNNASEISNIDSIKLDSISNESIPKESNSKVAKTRLLENLSKIAITKMHQLKTMVTRMFTQKQKKFVIGGGVRKIPKLQKYLQHYALVNKLEQNISTQLQKTLKIKNKNKNKN